MPGIKATSVSLNPCKDGKFIKESVLGHNLCALCLFIVLAAAEVVRVLGRGQDNTSEASQAAADIGNRESAMPADNVGFCRPSLGGNQLSAPVAEAVVQRASRAEAQETWNRRKVNKHRFQGWLPEGQETGGPSSFACNSGTT